MIASVRDQPRAGTAQASTRWPLSVGSSSVDVLDRVGQGCRNFVDAAVTSRAPLVSELGLDGSAPNPV